jgi:bifunctional DNA-binding transcriptional regulator/antitoxin component of YhaV-PrlF toxin-antitoxin module
MKKRSYVTHIKKNWDEYSYIELPEEITDELEWNENDTLECTVDENNNIIITRTYVYTKEVDKNDKSSNSGN